MCITKSLIYLVIKPAERQLSICNHYLDKYVIITDINMLVSGLRGPSSKYDIDIEEGNFKGELELKWESEPLRVRIVVMILLRLYGCTHATCKYVYKSQCNCSIV